MSLSDVHNLLSVAVDRLFRETEGDEFYKFGPVKIDRDRDGMGFTLYRVSADRECVATLRPEVDENGQCTGPAMLKIDEWIDPGPHNGITKTRNINLFEPAEK